MCVYWIACSSEFKCTYNRNSILSLVLSLPRLSPLQRTSLYRSFFCPLLHWLLSLSRSVSLSVSGWARPRAARARTHTHASHCHWWRKMHTSDKALWNGVCVNWSEISVHRTTSLSHSKFYCTCGKTNLMLDLLVNKWEVDKAKNIHNNSNNNGNWRLSSFLDARASVRWLFCCVLVCTRFYVFLHSHASERDRELVLFIWTVFTFAFAYVCVWQQRRLRIQLK